MKMKLMLILLLTALTVSFLLADPYMWDENGVAIRQGVNIEWSRASTVLDNGTVVYVWSDTRYGGRDLWAQAVDETGVLWGDAGVLVDGKPDRQEDPVIITTSDGNAIIAWIDFYDDPVNGGVYAQKISPTGELLWDDSVALCLADEVQISLNIVPDNDGGAYIIWLDYREGPVGIYGVHVDSNGNNHVGWPQDGLPLAAGPNTQHMHTFWEDGQGGAILAYINEAQGQHDVYVKRILSDGEIDWSYPLAEGPQEQTSVRIQPFGDNAFGFAYTDNSNGFRNVYVNVVERNGTFLWNDPIALNPAMWDQFNPRVLSTTDGNFIVVYEDLEFGTRNLHMQKLDISGNFLWGPNGMVVVDAAFDQRNPRIESDGAGGCYVIWDDGREGGHPEIDIYMQHVSSDGIISWEPNGRAVVQIPGEAFAPLIKPAGDHIFASWGDRRTGSIGIYFQAYNQAGLELLPDNGIPIYWGLSGDASGHQVIGNGDDVFVAWEDTRYANFGTQIKVQKLDSNGNILFDENGISIVDEHTNNYQQDLQATAHHQGGLALTWTEQPGDFVLVYAQAIDADGNPLWGAQGMRTSTLDYGFSQSYPNKPRISADGDGGYIIAWDETNQLETWQRNVKAQRIVNGQRVWDDEGVTIAYQTGTSQVDHFVQDVVGRYIIWYRVDQTDLYVKLLNEDGTVATGWDDYGNLICDASGRRSMTKSVITPEGLLLTWQDRRSGTASIYGQLINENGEIQWQDNGLALIDYDNDQTIISLEYSDGFFYLTWRDGRIDPGAQDVGLQKFDMDGNPQWGEPAPFVVSNQTIQDNPAMALIGDKLLIAWENDYSEIGADIYGQLANPVNGAVYWDPDGESMTQVSFRQVRPKIVPFDDMYGFVAWSDGRSSGKEEIIGIYAQKVDATWLSVEEISSLPVSHLQLHANYPNPFNPETSIYFDLKRNDRVSLKVYNVRGQLVRTLIDNEYLESGRHLHVWDGRDNNDRSVSSGVFFYQLQGEDITQVRKMLMLK